MTPTPERYTLTLEVLADPQARHGHPPRDGDYRLRLLLKLALRGLGLKCTRVAPAAGDTAETVPAGCHSDG